MKLQFVLFHLLRNRETTLKVLKDEKAEEHYLMLSELGRVLQELRGDLPGALCSSALRLGIK